MWLVGLTLYGPDPCHCPVPKSIPWKTPLIVDPGGAGLSKFTVVLPETVKRAKIVVLAVRVTVHGPVPEQALPLQPLKIEPVAGVAMSVTTVPLSNAAEQVAPQSIPGGLDVTVPLPEPSRVTERVNCVPPAVTPKRANTVVFAVRVSVQAVVPAQPPPVQPSKVEPVAGVAVRVTAVLRS